MTYHVMSCRQACLQYPKLPQHDQISCCQESERKTPIRGVMVCSLPFLCVMEESGLAVLDQPSPPPVMEESSLAVLDQPFPPLSLSAAVQEETRRTTQGSQQLFTSCSGCGECAISDFL